MLDSHQNCVTQISKQDALLQASKLYNVCGIGEEIPIMLKCPICSSKELRYLFSLYDDRYGYKGQFPLHRCENCRHKFIRASFDSDSLKDLYTDYYPRSEFSIENYTPRREVKGFDAWLNGENRLAHTWVPQNVRILDIGCGFGETLGYHHNRGCDVYGVEVDENIRRIAEKYKFKVHVGPFDPEQFERDFFDYITMDQVIEHLVKPIESLEGIYKILKPGGRVILTTPNTNGWGEKVFRKRWINWHAPYHLQHFSLQSLRIAGEMAGLPIEKTATITSPEWLHYQWIHLSAFPTMGDPSEYWSPKKELPNRHKRYLKTVSLLRRFKINHCITRFFDTLGMGDNLLIILRKP